MKFRTTINRRYAVLASRKKKRWITSAVIAFVCAVVTAISIHTGFPKRAGNTTMGAGEEITVRRMDVPSESAKY